MAAICITEDLLCEVLDEIREGATLDQICQRPDMPFKLDFYDALRDNTTTVKGKALIDAYTEALEDRAMSWQDDVADMYERLGAAEPDNMQLKLAADRGRMRLQMAKDQLQTIRQSRTQTVRANDIEVNIISFAPPKLEDLT